MSLLALERAIRRDRAIRESGVEPSPRGHLDILELIQRESYLQSETVHEFLREISSTNSEWVGAEIAKLICPLHKAGFTKEAHEIFSTLTGVSKVDSERAQFWFQRNSFVRDSIAEVLELKNIVSGSPDSWGISLIRLLSMLLKIELDADATPDGHLSDFDGHFHYTYYTSDRHGRDGWKLVAKAIEEGLAETAQRDTEQAFVTLQEELFESKLGLAICLPIVALLDVASNASTASWQFRSCFSVLASDLVCSTYATFAWRRLLRRRLTPKLNKQQVGILCNTVRNASMHSENVRFIELSDFRRFDVLSTDEIGRIEDLESSGKLFEPSDARKHDRMPRSTWGKDKSWLEIQIEKWPHEEDRRFLTLLGEASNDKTADPLLQADCVKKRSTALKRVFSRDEYQETAWSGEVLNWSAQTLKSFKRWQTSRSPDSMNVVAAYVRLLDKHLPWWLHARELAFESLRSEAPDEHRQRTESGLHWGSGDSIAGALSFLDELYYAPTGGSLDDGRTTMVQIIVQRWRDWPPFTRCLATALLRPFHWAQSAELQDLLLESLRNENSSQLIEITLNHLLWIRRKGIAQIFRLLSEKIETFSKPKETAHFLGSIAGDAVMRFRSGEERNEELADVDQWFSEIERHPTLFANCRHAFITSAVWAAEKQLSKSTLTAKHASAWLALIAWAASEWKSEEEFERHSAFEKFVTPILELNWRGRELAILLPGVYPIVLRVLRQSSLGAYYWVHRDIEKLLEHQSFRLTDPQLIELCKESVERVVNWMASGKTTNDLAYGKALYGGCSSELITKVMGLFSDREYGRRALAPIVDSLIDAGLRDVASSLRSELRRMQPDL